MIFPLNNKNVCPICTDMAELGNYTPHKLSTCGVCTTQLRVDLKHAAFITLVSRGQLGADVGSHVVAQLARL